MNLKHDYASTRVQPYQRQRQRRVKSLAYPPGSKTASIEVEAAMHSPQLPRVNPVADSNLKTYEQLLHVLHG